MKKIFSLFVVMIFILPALNIYASDDGGYTSVIIQANESFSEKSFTEAFNAKIKYRYKNTFCGICAYIYESDIEKIKLFPGVEGVYAQALYKVPDDEEEPLKLRKKLSSMRLSETEEDLSGEGTVVAVIDSGCNISNTVFSLPSDTSAVKFKKSDIAEIISENELSAESGVSSFTADKAYKNEKFPFVFDYTDSDFNVYNSSVPHGTSVAGVIGGKGAGVYSGNDYYGVLPECQLIILKVVDSSGYIEEGNLLAAFEDAISIGVDGINISIGSAAGFSTSKTNPFDLSVAAKGARQKGIFVAASAGNDGLLGRDGNAVKTAAPSLYPSVLNPDYALVCSPSVCEDFVSVAAANMSGAAMGNFSAWGPAPSLELKPDITAWGSSVPVPRNASGTFIQSSGTSYSSPNLCGTAVKTAKNINSRFGYEGEELTRLAENLLMSTSDIIYSGNVPVSPRKQGSGFANYERAASSNAVLYGGDQKTKINLYDFETNAISFEFTIKNLSEEALKFSPSAKVICDAQSNGYITAVSELMKTDSVTFSESEISLSSGEEKNITVNIVLNSNALTAKKQIFQNGFYVEGFILLTDLSGNCGDLNMPFMGFYGDWSTPPVFIPQNTRYATGFASILKSSASCSNLFYYGNNYFTNNGVAPDASNYQRAAFSPNGDKKFDIATPYFGLYRNIRKLLVSVTDKNGNEVASLTADDMQKTNGIIYLQNSVAAWDGKNSSGELCPDGQYYYNMTAYLDYENKYQTFTLPIFLDTTPPEATALSISESDGRKLLSAKIEDNHSVQAVALCDGETTDTLEAVFTQSENNIYTFDITGYSCKSFDIEMYDFGLNGNIRHITPGKDYIAYYDGENRLTHAEIYDIADVYSPPERAFALTGNDSYAKRFIWLNNMQPVKVILH